MAIGTPTVLNSVSSLTNGTTITIPSVSPTANATVLVIALTKTTTAEDGDPTVAGCGATWTQCAEILSNNDRGVRAWWANEASFSTSTIVITAAGTDEYDFYHAVAIELTGAAAGLAQTAVAATGTTGTAPNTVSTNYGSTTDAANTAIGIFGDIGTAGAGTGQAGWTDTLHTDTLIGNSALEVHYIEASAETKVECSWNNGTTTIRYFNVGLEIAPAASNTDIEVGLYGRYV